jgi:leucyl aminopeptidase (aminopeptidase T)
MKELTYKKFAQILVDHSVRVSHGDRVAIESTTNATSLVCEINELVLLRGGQTHVLLSLLKQEKLLFNYAHDE